MHIYPAAREQKVSVRNGKCRTYSEEMQNSTKS